MIAAFKKADLPLSLTIEHADMNALLKRAAQDLRAAQAEVFATHLNRLAGAGSEEQRMLFFEAGQAMIDDQQADAVLLAGTDLGLVFDNQTPGFRVIDVIELHVNALISMVARRRAALSPVVTNAAEGLNASERRKAT